MLSRESTWDSLSSSASTPSQPHVLSSLSSFSISNNYIFRCFYYQYLHHLNFLTTYLSSFIPILVIHPHFDLPFFNTTTWLPSCVPICLCFWLNFHYLLWYSVHCIYLLFLWPPKFLLFRIPAKLQPAVFLNSCSLKSRTSLERSTKL